jgi:hypothetical protein
MITIKDFAKSQEVVKSMSYSDTRFSSDREYVEDFADFANFEYRLDLGVESTPYGLLQTAVFVDGQDMFLASALESQGFRGESQISMWFQRLTLKGFNSFTKDLESDDYVHIIDNVYDNYLKAHGYDVSVSDIIELGEWLDAYKCYILTYVAENGDKHRLVVNERHQLSSISIKYSGREVSVKSKSKRLF